MKRILTAGLSLLFVSTILVSCTEKPSDQETPDAYKKAEEVKVGLSGEGVLLEEDYLYTSPDGYRVIVPKGFKFVTGSGGFSLAAVKSIDEIANITFLIKIIADSPGLNELVIYLVDEGKAVGKEFHFEESASPNMRKGTVNAVKNGKEFTGFTALTKNGSTLFHIFVTTTKSHEQHLNPVFDQIMDSFKVM